MTDRLCAAQFERLIQDDLPALGRHLADEGVAPSMYCSHWFMTAFAYALPFDHLLRVWDVFLLEGLKVEPLLLLQLPLPGSRIFLQLPYSTQL